MGGYSILLLYSGLRTYVGGYSILLFYSVGLLAFFIVHSTIYPATFSIFPLTNSHEGMPSHKPIREQGSLYACMNILFLLRLEIVDV